MHTYNSVSNDTELKFMVLGTASVTMADEGWKGREMVNKRGRHKRMIFIPKRMTRFRGKGGTATW